MCCVEGFVACSFLLGEGGVELAGGDLFGAGLDVAELARGEIAFGGSHGRAEGAADDGSRGVEIAGAGRGIEYGAGLAVSYRGLSVFDFVGEERRGFVVFAEDAGGGIAGEERGEADEGFCDAFADAMGSLRVVLLEGLQPFAKAGCVLLRDRKDAMTALRASGAADEMRSAALGGGGECGVHDLDEGEGSVHRCSHFRRVRFYDAGYGYRTDDRFDN